MAGLDDGSPTRQGMSKRSGAGPRAAGRAFDTYKVSRVYS